jgi:hypothetical protein
MNARDIVTELIKPKIELNNQLNETDTKVDFFGTSQEVTGRITQLVEGKVKIIEFKAWELPVVE